MYKRGSSLILVLVVIASIMTIVLGTQRVSLVQFAQSNREEDSLFALYAAKAGIEDGLVRFRHNRDVETGLDKVFRMDLSSGEAVGGSLDHEVVAGSPISDIGASYRPSGQYYDLNIDFKVRQVGAFPPTTGTPTGTGGGIKIAKDEAFQLTGFSNEDFWLRFAFQAYNPGTNDPCSSSITPLVQLQKISSNTTSGPALEQVPVTLVNNAYDSSGGNNIRVAPDLNTRLNILRIRPYGCDVRVSFMATTGAGGQVVSNNANHRFDGLVNLTGTPITRVTATGYFGQAKRTLIGEIDRKSGQLIGIYDFNAYAGGSIGR